MPESKDGEQGEADRPQPIHRIKGWVPRASKENGMKAFDANMLLIPLQIRQWTGWVPWLRLSSEARKLEDGMWDEAGMTAKHRHSHDLTLKNRKGASSEASNFATRKKVGYPAWSKSQFWRSHWGGLNRRSPFFPHPHRKRQLEMP